METNEITNKENQIADYAAEIKQIEIEGYELGVRKARNALFWAAVLYLVGELISLFRQPIEFSIWIVVILVIEIGVFVALGFWTRKKPYTAIILGISYFTLLIILIAIINGINSGAEGVLLSLWSGIIFKVIIYVALFRALGDAKELQRAIEEKKFSAY